MLNSSAATQSSNAPEQDTGYVSAPAAVSLPKGGGAIQGIGEKFDVNPVTGTGSLSIPIAVSPGRSGFSPQLTLSYDSGAGNGPFGLGWNLSVPSVRRKTQKGLPQYRDAEDSDIYLLSGAEDLVPVLDPNQGWTRQPFEVTVPGPQVLTEHLSSYPDTGTYTVERYRPRTEGLFARIERWQHRDTGDVHWRSLTKDNITSVYGKDSRSRIADPAQPTHVFEWLLCESYDDKGNVIVYEYKQENADQVNPTHPEEKNRLANGHSYSNQYLKQVFYCNQNPYERGNWLFQVVFDYGEHGSDEPRLADGTQELPSPEDLLTTDNPTPEEVHAWSHRPDAFSSYRSGFEIRTQRLCRRVLMFHRFDADGNIDENSDTWHLVRSTDLRFEHDPVATYLVTATQTGYLWDANAQGYQRRAYPPLELTYNRPVLDDTLHTLDSGSLENLPVGLDGAAYQWVDLDGEGISGILTEQGSGWFYKPNLGAGQFGALQTVATKPSIATLQSSQQRLLDLAGDGQLDLVVLDRGSPGFYEREHDETWTRFKSFRSIPNVDWADPNLRFIELTGDGHADLLITEDRVFTWYPSQAEMGFGPSTRVPKGLDDEKGPALVFADADQSVYLADMSGDGLNDILRIRNGQVCYWPNRGYGRFGAKVTMGRAPRFDHPELFEQRRIRLADIDGSGTTDILYLGRDAVHIWFNQAGNRWSESQTLTSFPRVDNLASVQTVDLLGHGTACLVWSSPLPGQRRQPMRYIDLMGGQKPHLLQATKNNMGAETKLTYVSAIQFYLADKQAGTPWITKIPFPVQVLEQVETLDHISGNRFVSTYRYRHGYFDGEEREFRGFGYVEQRDTESFADFQQTDSTNVNEAPLHVPPVLTKTWFHTGAYQDRDHISQQYIPEYFAADPDAVLLPDTLLPPDLTPQAAREACRALRGQALRQEVYALDGSDQEPYPYTVTESYYEIRPVQPVGANRYGVFFTHARESLAYHYERNPADPRIAHQLTLEVDEYGTVLKSAAIAYPRRQPTDDEQTRTHITYTENQVIHKPDEATWYRLGLPLAASTYEITGLTPAFPANLETLRTDLEALANDPAADIPYETFADGHTPQRRLVEQARTYYRANADANTTDPTRPPLGNVESLALPCESFRLAFTPGLVQAIYGDKLTPADLATLLQDEGRYVELDGNWWIPSGQQAFDPAQFYLPTVIKDPFGQTYRMDYGPYSLLVERTTDPLDNQVQVENDYRVLQPRQLTDPNGNRAAVAFDVLGMVAGTAVMGKTGQGDDLTTFPAEMALDDLEDFWTDPFGAAPGLLGTATTRILYDLDRYRREGQPVFAATLARETHQNEPLPPAGLKIQVSVQYSDGFGRELQTKIQAEPGLAPGRDSNGDLKRDLNDGLVLEQTAPRWVGTGRTVYNNKGKPVKQYEPFFSATHRYEAEAELTETGVTPILFYDPLQRVIANLHPNHTYDKVVFDPWQQTTWDVNDTLTPETREDFKADADVGGYFNGLAEADYLPTWYSRYSTGTAEEQDAAAKTVAHAGTPSTVHLDTLGRPFLTVAHNRIEDNSTWVDEFYETLMVQDIEGQQLIVQDARQNAVMVYATVSRDGAGNLVKDGNGLPVLGGRGYDLLGNSLFTHSMDAGDRWILNNVAGNPIRGWDSRGHRTRPTYDALQRPTQLYVQPENQQEFLAERTVYGEELADPTATNHRGQVYQVFDAAGVVTSDAYDFKGNLLSSTRQLVVDYKTLPDWSSSPALEPEIYGSRTVYDALNRPIQMVAPRDVTKATVETDVFQPVYNEANLLEQMPVWLKHSGDPAALLDPQTADLMAVQNIDYNEKGQRTLIEYGNGVTTRYTYDAETFRLTRLHTVRAHDGAILQDLNYTYDPVGNITQIQDQAQQTIFFNNLRVDPHADYTYDALYRLIKATGREHLGQTGGTLNRPVPSSDTDIPRVNLPHPGDGTAMGKYRQEYVYDAVGNILEMIHTGTDPNQPGWRRCYQYAVDSNRLLSTGYQSDPLVACTPANRYAVTAIYPDQYPHDAHGNMTLMPHLTLMQWDYRDQLQGVGETSGDERRHNRNHLLRVRRQRTAGAQGDGKLCPPKRHPETTERADLPGWV
jgi:YD repeat-containing protein